MTLGVREQLFVPLVAFVDRMRGDRERESAVAGYELRPIVVVTAFDSVSNHDRARDAGCDGYLDKPVSPQRILEEVRRLVGPSGNGASEA